MTRKRRAFIPLAVTTVLALAACSGGTSKAILQLPTTGKAAVQVNLDEASAAKEVATKSSWLGIEIMSQSPAEESVVFSPASLAIALGMLGANADGETEAQLTELLGAPGPQRDKALNALVGALTQYETDPAEIDIEKPGETPQIHIANQILIREGEPISETYLEQVKKYYGPAVGEVNFTALKTKELLDEWVRTNTAGMIDKSALELDSDTLLTLQNAVVFSSKWQNQFMEVMTEPGDFHLADGTTVSAEFMNDTKQDGYAEFNGWKILVLPYDEVLQAQFVLPPEGTDLSELTPEILGGLKDALNEEPVQVRLPKLDLRSKLDLTKSLPNLGLSAPFVDGNLEYIIPGKGAYVSQLVQQARIKVSEEGTVAAAVTEGGIAETLATIAEKEFIADRPHFVFVTDSETGWDLFQVKVMTPKSEES